MELYTPKMTKMASLKKNAHQEVRPQDPQARRGVCRDQEVKCKVVHEAGGGRTVLVARSNGSLCEPYGRLLANAGVAELARDVPNGAHVHAADSPG